MNEARILVVEDEPSIREVVSLYLKRAGYQVSVVGDGRTALWRSCPAEPSTWWYWT